MQQAVFTVSSSLLVVQCSMMQLGLIVLSYLIEGLVHNEGCGRQSAEGRSRVPQRAERAWKDRATWRRKLQPHKLEGRDVRGSLHAERARGGASLCEDVRNAIERHETRSRRRLADSLNKNKCENPGKFWKIFKKLRGSTPLTYPIKHNNQLLLQTTDKLNAFQNHLQNLHITPQDPNFDNDIYIRITDHVTANPQLYLPLQTPAPQIQNNIPYPLTTDITANEVAAAICRTKNPAAGPDNIPNIIYRHYPQRTVEFLAAIYTASFRRGALPPRWKHALILLFPKPRKDLTNVDNYRPISLTLTICKLMEHILNLCLQQYVDDADLIPQTQAGFRPHTDIIDQILKVLTPVETARERRQTIAIVALDMQRAFDTVWHDGLRYKLTNLGLPPQITRWISDFLQDRTAQIKINNQLPTPLIIHGGVPQGTVLSPILYNLFVADIPTTRQTNVTLGQFADDTIYVASGRTIYVATQGMNNALTDLTTWLKQWRLKLNVSKTQAIL
ncbi:hypothetical protein ANN_26066 [Periplaneta americana]|uniref:Reverse transcriptase domain-containing protein n=1 Tax=Periplaneta americana TaxID=6978 RepID=A0ABQ8S5E7_PERAM|nr:hypothetical protein ANN_26066 [Periplaneta americana]